jgi:glycosyltransferase involved in cell wall biosynthesis
VKAAFIIPARNKEKWVGVAVTSALRQTYSPLEIVLSDQGSEDHTFAVMKDLASKYDGVNKVSLIDCKDTQDKGMSGLNRHIHCIMNHVDADAFIFNSADDWSHPERSSKVVKVFEDFGPDYVGTGVEYATSSDPLNTQSDGVFLRNGESGFVSVKEIISERIGGSSSCAWSREFYDRVGPIPGAVGPDTYLPPLAALGKGYYFLAEILHVYFKHASPDNTGLWGVYNSMDNAADKLRVAELECWQIAAGLKSVMDQTNKMGLKVDDESGKALMEAFLEKVSGWVEVRHQLGLNRISPMALPI